MNRNEFLIVTVLSVAVVALLVAQVVFGRMANIEQNRLMQAQQFVNQGQVCLKNLQQVALRTIRLSQQTNDQALKDLLARQQISINTPSSQSSESGAAPTSTPASAPAPASAPTPAPTH